MKEYFIFRTLGVARYYIEQLYNKNTAEYAIFFAVAVLLCMVVTYLLGGLNFAIIISKKKYGVDVRNFGSGNAGMTNMRRTFGKKAGRITLLGDAAKTFAACIWGYLLLGRLGCFIAGLFCMIGHMFPVQYKFKGGKGVVCTAVVVLMTDIGNPSFYFVPVLFLILLACFAIIVIGTKYISLGSIMCILLYPLFFHSFESNNINIIVEGNYTDPVALTYMSEYGIYMTVTVVMAFMVIFMHRENIKRLLAGKESKFSFHMSSKDTIYEKEKLEKDSLNGSNDKNEQ